MTNVDAARTRDGKQRTSILQLELTAAKVKRDELMHLSRQLGAFVKAGLPLIEAVRILGSFPSAVAF